MLFATLTRVESLVKLTIDGSMLISALNKPWSESLKAHILHLRVIQHETLAKAQSFFPLNMMFKHLPLKRT